MCLSYIYWAHIDKLYYGNTKQDAANIGFDDSFIYKELELKPEQRRLISRHVMNKEALAAFNIWEEKSDKIEY